MAPTDRNETARDVVVDTSGPPLKQWEIRAALRTFQRLRQGSTRGNMAEQMVAAAWELVDEEADFTVKQVTERAGVALPTFYRHFGSKDELILAMLEESIDRGTAKETEAAARLDDPVEQLRFLVTNPIVQGYDEAGVRSLRWRARERQRLSQHFPAAVDAVHEPRREAIIAAIKSANAAGLATSPDPELDGNLIQHLVLTMTHLQWGAAFGAAPDVTADAVWRLCWNGLGPRREPTG